MKPKKLLWKNRERDLASLIRYYDPNHRFEVMFYRTNLLVHTKRTKAITASMIPTAQEFYTGLDVKLIELMNIYHDDHELIDGDTSFQLKLLMEGDKEAMSNAKLKELESIDKIAAFYPKKVGRYWYKEILLRAFYKECRESQLHSYADKHDGYHEALHEVLAGNTVFLEPVINYEKKTFAVRFDKFAKISELFNSSVANQNPFLQFPVVDLMRFFAKGNRPTIPHTPQLLGLETGIPSYEAWKNITISNLPNGLELLTKQVEFQKEL